MENKSKKTKGPIRWEAIVPFTVFCLLVFFYFRLFFDHNLKSLIEFGGYHSLGAEVNVATVETSFLKASIKIKDIQITNPEQPTHNNLTIGEIRFSLLWDALLRAKFVVNEAAVEGIGFNQLRKHPGKVKPPEPEKESALKKEADKLKTEAIEKTKSQNQDNVLGNIASLMSGGTQSGELDKLKSKLVSEEKIKAFESDLKSKQKQWEERIKKLPQAKEFEALGDRLKKVKTSGFANIEELNNSIREVQSILDEANKKIAEVNAAKNDLDKDLKLTDQGLKDIQNQINKDIKDLEAHFKIPQLDAKSISTALFKRYTAPYLNKINHYKGLFYKYAPPNLTKKDSTKPEVEIQPRPRENGTIYEFGRPNSYPLFWVKKTIITSHFQNNANPAEAMGNIKGQITDITSNQALLGRPTIATIAGDFPAQKVSGLNAKLVIDNTQANSMITLGLQIAQFPIESKQLVDSEEVNIGFNKAQGSLIGKFELVNYTQATLNLKNDFSQIDYAVTAKNKDVEEILKNVFNQATTTNLLASGSGKLPSFDLNIQSNLGAKIQQAFEKQIQAKIDEARKKIQAMVNAEIAKQKELIEKQVNAFKSQTEGQIQKAQTEAESQKKLAESKINEARNDFNRRIEAERKKVENDSKKKLEEEAKKAAEELKKKLGF
ncbi:MAG: TIGR03545 family protein [Bdellovibrionales bacterium]|nr:TIGR03545 family protein [Bdellovibrionales bacterium]